MHYIGANGPRRPKVFKLTRRRLEPGRPATITRRHRFDHVSIRRIHPGQHTIDIQVNGHVLGAVNIDVLNADEHAGEQIPVKRPERRLDSHRTDG